MTHQEVKQLLTDLKGSGEYDIFFKSLTVDKGIELLNRWCMMLENEDHVVLCRSCHVKAIYDANKWRTIEYYEPFPLVAGFNPDGTKYDIVTRAEIMEKLKKLNLVSGCSV